MKLLNEQDSAGLVPDERIVGKQLVHVRTGGHYKVIGIVYNCDDDLWHYLYQLVEGGTIYSRSIHGMSNGRFEEIA